MATMIRTQISLTERQCEALAVLSRSSGRTRSELVRQAVDALIEQSGHARRQAAIDRIAGLWKDRIDLPDFKSLRKEWGRR